MLKQKSMQRSKPSLRILVSIAFTITLRLPIPLLATAESTEPHHINSRRKSKPAIPNLRGFGSHTTAGNTRFGNGASPIVFTVTSLADSGANTLRRCIEINAPRRCRFKVAGQIKLKSILKIKNPYISILGASAPHPGITIINGGISIETHDVAIQHLAIRPGDSPQGVPPRFRDAVSIGAPFPRSAYNVALDHLSLTWAVDENLSTAYPTTHDITIANSIIAEGLHRSIHPKGPHSKGVMIGNGSRRVTLFRNVISSNEERNPYIKPGSSVEMINNLVYGWGTKGPWSLCNLSNNEDEFKPVRLSFIGNLYIPGPWSYRGEAVWAKDIDPRSRVYISDSGVNFNHREVLVSAPPLASNKAVPAADEIVSTEALFNELVKEVGSRPFDRSEIDKKILDDIAQRSGGIRDRV
jgi:hypothetical protein